MESRREFVRQMAKGAFSCYRKHGWGSCKVCPIGKQPFDYLGDKKTGWTAVCALYTLWLMGLTEEFELAKQFVAHEMDFATIHDEAILLIEIVTEIMGALLSTYALTKDAMFIDKAKEIADVLKANYDTPSGFPMVYLNPYDADHKEYNFSELTVTKLEHQYLSHLTGDEQYVERANKTRQSLIAINKPHGLYAEFLNIDTGDWATEMGGLKSTLGYYRREFYIDLCKSYIQSGGKDVQAIEMYKDALDAVEKIGMIRQSPSGLTYATTYHWDTNKCEQTLEQDCAYLGAMLSLGADAMRKALDAESVEQERRETELARIQRHWQLAKDITETFHQCSKRTKSGLTLQTCNFAHEHRPNDKFIECVGYSLGHEIAESYFTLWRLTRDEKYREYAWQLAQAIETHCRVQQTGGYTCECIDNSVTNDQGVEMIDLQPPILLGATLKYLYLIFCDDPQLLPLDQWVFNSAGHPLPILNRKH